MFSFQLSACFILLSFSSNGKAGVTIGLKSSFRAVDCDTPLTATTSSYRRKTRILKDGCRFNTMGDVSLTQGPQSRGGRGAHAPPPQYFQNYKELVRKIVLCPPPNIELLMCPPPPISKLLVTNISRETNCFHDFVLYPQ